MASIKDILSSYGSAARADYPQGDDVEWTMDRIVSFIEQHGYEFEDDLLKNLRQDIGLCPIHDIFKGSRSCDDCKFSVKKGNRFVWYECRFKNKEI